MTENSYVLAVTTGGAVTQRLEACGPLADVLSDAEYLLNWIAAEKITIRTRKGDWIATVTPVEARCGTAKGDLFTSPGDSAGGPAARVE